MSVCRDDVLDRNHPELAAFLTRIADEDSFELPVLPEVAAQLLQLTNDIDCDPLEIVGLIRRDQSLTTHLLRIANSARYSTGITVTSIQQAVARLGLIRVREIVILVACRSRIFDVAEFDDEVRVSFRRSLTAAVFSQEIARLRRLNVEEAFLAGLLHDVGRPILLQYLADCRRSHGLTVSDDAVRQTAAEHRIPIGSRLITAWKLPERVAEAVRCQHNPLESVNCQALSAILKLAADLAELALHDERVISPADCAEDLLRLLAIYPDQIAQVISKRDEIMAWVDSTI